jgi:hypothetical protein
MRRTTRIQLIVTAAVTVFGLLVTAWASHVQSYLLAPLSIFPYLLGVMLGGTAHTPSTGGCILGLTLEYGLIGYFVSVSVCFFVKEKKRDRD